MIPFEFSDCLTGFSVAFRSYRAGIYNVYIGVFVIVYDRISVFRHFLAQPVRFILINFAPKGIKSYFHSLPTFGFLKGHRRFLQKDGAVLLEPTVDEVTYSDGTTEEVYGFDISSVY